jgi:predicted nucleic acid-binding protein
LILDTNGLSAYLDKAPGAVEAVSQARELAIPVIVAGEFAFGIARSRHRDAYERSLQRMLDVSRQHSMPVMSQDSLFDFVGGLRRRAWQ